MERNKEYELYLGRVTKKGNKALAEFEIYFEEEIKKHGDTAGTEIVEYFIIASAHPILTFQQKTAIIQIFQHVVYVIHCNEDLKGYVPQLVGCILKFFNDPSDRVRFNAISSIYNVFKFLDEECLFVFTRTFKELPCIITDPASEVRQAAAHLNHTMKILLNNAILDHYDFDYEDFINILTENFLLPHHLVKEFLIDWINTIVEIKEFETARYLPFFLKKLFIFLVDENKNVKAKAEECLKGLIDSFKLSFTCSKEHIPKRYRLEDTQTILVLLIKIIEESIIFEVSSEIDIHVLNWLENFTGFLVEQIDVLKSEGYFAEKGFNLSKETDENFKQRMRISMDQIKQKHVKDERSQTHKTFKMKEKHKPFLIKIYAVIFKPLFKVLIQVMSLESISIQKAAKRIHEKLLSIYPILRQVDEQIDSTAIHLYTSIGNCKSLMKAEMIIQWTAKIAAHGNELISKEIDKFVLFIVEKTCQTNLRNLDRVFKVFRNSVFSSTGQYFKKLIRALLMHLSLKKCSNQAFIMNSMIHLPNPANNFLVIAREISEMQSIKQTKFLNRVLDTMLNFLLTLPCLSEFREKVRSCVHQENKKSQQFIMIEYQKEIKIENFDLFKLLVKLFIENRATIIGFSFLIRDYESVCAILEDISQEESVDSQFMSSLVKVGNLLMSNSMHQLFMDISGTEDVRNKKAPQQFLAKKALLSFLMFLPINKITKPLKLKAQDQLLMVSCSEQSSQSSEQDEREIKEVESLQIKWKIYSFYQQQYEESKEQQN